MIKRLLAAGLAALALAGNVAAETAWRPFKALKLYVSDEAVVDAAVFTARGHFLVAPGASEHVFLLSPKEYTVHSADRAALGDVTTLDIERKSDLTLVGVLQKQGATLKWEADETRYALSHKPPLIGAVSVDELRTHTTKYDADIEAYVPDVLAVEKLAAISTPTELVVGFGTWCPICAEWLPRFIKSVEKAGNDKISMSFISINEDLDRPADLLEANAIDGVPTFIVRQGGEELGRITQDWLEEEPEAVLEKRIVEILGGS